MKDILKTEKTVTVYKTQIAVYLIMLIASNFAIFFSLWDAQRRFKAGLIINVIILIMLLFMYMVNRYIKKTEIKNAFFVISAISLIFVLLGLTRRESIILTMLYSGPILMMIFNVLNTRYNLLTLTAYVVIIITYGLFNPTMTLVIGKGFYILCLGSILAMGVALNNSQKLLFHYDKTLKERISLEEEKNLALLDTLSDLEQSEETIKSQYEKIIKLNMANQQVIDQLKAIVDAGDDGIINIDLERQVVNATLKAQQILGESFATQQQLMCLFNANFEPGDAIAFNHLLESLQFQNPNQKTLTSRELCYKLNGVATYLKINGLTYSTTQLDYDTNLPGRHMVLVIKDVTSEYTKAKHIYQMAYEDPLTGLSNRTAFLERAVEAITLQGVDQISIMVFDIDNFKYINDSFGFAWGDILLQQVGDTLKHCMVGHLTCPSMLLAVARFDGDAFGLMWATDDFDETSKAFYEWIKANLSSQILDKTHLNLTFSAGVAESPDPNFALTAAEIAMYKTKERGRATYSKFDPNYLKEVQRHHQLSTALEEALSLSNQTQLQLHYQPIHLIADNSLVNYEALARWNHPILGNITPDEFISVAEKSGQILALGLWVQQEALRFAKSTGHNICINVSPMQLLQTEDFASQLLKALDELKIPRHQFGIEVTETVLVQDRERANEQLYTLKRAGVRVSLDDFGSGYSSLSYLMDLPINTLKIDKAFIRPLTDVNQNEAKIVGTILQLARQLGLTTVAEGVEYQYQLDILAQLNCTMVQGYLFSKPVPESQIVKRTDL